MNCIRRVARKFGANSGHCIINKKITLHECDTFIDYTKNGPLVVDTFETLDAKLKLFIFKYIKTNIFF